MNPQYEAHKRMCKSIGDMANENKRLHNKVAQLYEGAEEAKQRIKRLEEAGDALCENSNPSRWDSPADTARKLTDQSNWNKAKETNP